MEFGKYIVVDMGLTSCGQAVIFDSLISHDTFLKLVNREFILSAGMFCVGAKVSDNDPDDIDVSVFGESVTLNKKVRKGTDERLIKRVLRREIM